MEGWVCEVFGFRVSHFGYQVSGFGFLISGIRLRVSGYQAVLDRLEARLLLVALHVSRLPHVRPCNVPFSVFGFEVAGSWV